MKTQILKNERTWFGGKLGFDLGWAVRCWLCGMVLVGSVGANGWAQLPESASIDPATLDKEMFDKEMFDKEVRDKEVRDKEVRDEEMADKEMVDKEMVDKEVVDKEVVDKEVVDKEMFAEDLLEEADAQKTGLTVEALKQLSADAQSLLVRAAEAVVSIDGGSGVIVSEDGWVMTASHVCGRPGRQIQVRLANGLIWPAKTYGLDRQKDTGMVKLLGDHVWPFVEIKQQVIVEPGDWCVVMGYPWDTESLKTPAVRLGRVTAVSENRIATDVPIIGGDSGGPVFSAKGDLLAISSRIRLDVNQNLHVPVATFVKQIGALRQAKFIRTTGVKKKETIDDSLSDTFGRNAEEVRNAVADLVAETESSVVRSVSVEADSRQLNPAQ